MRRTTSTLRAGLMLCMLAGPAAGVTYTVRPGEPMPGMDNLAYAVTAWDSDGVGPQPEQIIVGGSFKIAGDQVVNGVAAWDGAAWQSVGGGIMAGAPTLAVYALTVFNGQVIAGGSFTKIGTLTTNSIARWDGVQWRTLAGSGLTQNGMPGSIRALAVYNGDLIVGGSFNTANGATGRNNIVRWDGSNWRTLGNGIAGEVQSLTVHNGELIAAGYFTMAGGVPCTNIARWDGTQWRDLGGGPSGALLYGRFEVTALATYNGELIVGGAFLTAGGLTCNSIARWDGTTWATLGAGVELNYGYVRALMVHDSKLLVGGWFRSVNGSVSCDNLASWDGSTWQRFSGGPDLESAVYGVVDCSYGLVVSGSFSQAGSDAAASVARWDGTTWHRLGDGLNDVVRTAAVYNGELFIGGDFTRIGDQPVGHIARHDGSAWHALGSGLSYVDLPYKASAYVTDMLEYDGELIVGGTFNRAGGIPTNDLARWDGTNWFAFPGSYGTVRSLTICNGDLIVAASFPADNPGDRASIARWDGQIWQPLGTEFLMSSGAIGNINAMIEYNGELIAAGWFSSAGGTPCNNIARWDGTSWQPLGAGAGHIVEALAVYNGELIVGGAFGQAGGAANTSYLARWDGSQWLSFASRPSSVVHALAVYNGELIIGGIFSQQTGATVSKYLARWNGTTWQAMGFSTNSFVSSLRVCRGELVVTGNFSTVGGYASPKMARFVMAGDADGDGLVDVVDLLYMVAAFGSVKGDAQYDPRCDTSLDGAVDVVDLLAMVDNWGESVLD